ncbi:putative MPP superfamily phosphohydrolase [Scopulibacillus daqui]|uniref:MPP superfamily phosphohydrolase n=1 Tax=Scopulibacillus daqui TaxID=1469162 RepID=A0ABS2PZ56_9BACL|nr:metallophosphoesterase [Scopulibacillus daqui]MBM7645320.1 putative MPP superfamily phosphohydrolase [Scopulibacillus daqui]
MLWGLLVIIIAMAVILVYMFFQAHRHIVLDVDITIEDLPEAFDGYQIFFISDIHRRLVSFKLLKQIKSQPDIVVIGGDLTETGVPFSRVEENVRRLSQVGPIIFIWGNHDLYVDREALQQIFKKFQVKILDNQALVFKRGKDHLNIVGINDVTNHLDRLDEALEGRKKGTTVLLSHNPDIKYQLHEHHRIPLVISGHTHGGQIRLFGWGLREKGGIKEHPFGMLIVSKGYGTTWHPLRLGAPPDTLLLTLRSAK